MSNLHQEQLKRSAATSWWWAARRATARAHTHSSPRSSCPAARPRSHLSRCKHKGEEGVGMLHYAGTLWLKGCLL